MRFMCVIGLCVATQFACYNSPLDRESTNLSGSGKQAQASRARKSSAMEKVVDVTPSIGTISCGANGLVFVGSSDQHFWISVDGGGKWKEGRIPYEGTTTKTEPVPSSGGWYDLVRSTITAAGHIYVVGYLEEAGSVIFSSTDEGRTWKSTEYPDSTLNGIDSGAGNVWLVGTVESSPLVLKGTNQQQWHVIWKGEKRQYFEGVDFLDSTSGWIVGAKGLILHGLEAGRRWELQQSPTLNNLRSVSFGDSQNGFIVGEQGTILRTNDGGLTWLKCHSETKADLTMVVAMSPEEACAVGRNGTVLVSNDGGKQWHHQDFGAADVYALAVGDKAYWIGASDGRVFRLRAE